MKLRGKTFKQAFIGVLVVFVACLAGCGGSQGPSASLDAEAGNSTGDSSGAAVKFVPAEMPVGADKTLDEVLTELEGLKTPDGVDSELFSELKTALRDMLTAGGSEKFASKVPESNLSSVKTLAPRYADDESIILSWQEVNVGDYNMDGQVTINDLEPVGRFYKRTRSMPDWIKAKVADGDNNGEVNIADITPIGQFINNTINGFKVFRSPAFHHGLQEYLAVPRPNSLVGTEDGFNIAVVYTFMDDSVEPGQEYEYFVAPYDADLDKGIESNHLRASTTSTFGVQSTSDGVAQLEPELGVVQDIVPDQVLLHYPGEHTETELYKAVYVDVGGKLVGRVSGTDTYRVQVEDATKVEFTGTTSLPETGYALSPVVLFSLSGVTAADGSLNDVPIPQVDRTTSAIHPNYWHRQGIHADEAWAYNAGDGIKIAVVDTGVDSDHIELEDCIYSAVRVGDHDNDPEDVDGHGTHVIGLIAAAKDPDTTSNDDQLEITGVAYDSEIISLKTGKYRLGEWRPQADEVIEAINIARLMDADVINLSLSNGPSYLLWPWLVNDYHNALDAAEDEGIIVVASAGNESDEVNFQLPASYSTVFTVGGVEPRWNIDYEVDRYWIRWTMDDGVGSNWGVKVDISAPASGVKSTYPGDLYAMAWGTSQAAPMVSAAASMIKALYPDACPGYVRDIIRDTGSAIQADLFIGDLLNVYACLQAVQQDQGLYPEMVVTPPNTIHEMQPGTTKHVWIHIKNDYDAKFRLDWRASEADDDSNIIRSFDVSEGSLEIGGHKYLQVELGAPLAAYTYTGKVVITSVEPANDPSNPMDEVTFTVTVPSEETYSVYGFFREADNTPIEDVTVTLAGYPSQQTGNDGYFLFNDVEEGQHQLHYSKPGWTFNPSSPQTVTVNGNTEVSTIVGTPPGYVVTGNAGVAFADVTVRDSGDNVMALDQADETGTWDVTLASGTGYTATVGKAGWHFIPPQRTFNVVNSDVTVPAFTAVANSVSGTVVPEIGGNVGNVQVTVSGPVVEQDLTISNGTWSIDQLPNGVYTVTVSKSGWWFTFTGGVISFTINDNNVVFGDITARGSMTGVTIAGVSGSGTEADPFILSANQTYPIVVNSAGGDIGAMCSYSNPGPFYLIQGLNTLKTYEFGPKQQITVSRPSPAPGDPAAPVTFWIKVWGGA